MPGGQLNEAIRAYRMAITLAPTSAWYHQSLGHVVARKGWFLVASSLFRRARQLDAKAVERWHLIHTPPYDQRTPVPEPVFVLGCQHSGTTILTRLLGRHPRLVHAEARETHLFAFDTDEVNRRLRAWDEACVREEKTRWVEKSVIHTLLVPRLLAARPRARFVMVVRDGRDVVASLKTRQYAFSSLDELIQIWSQTSGILQELVARPGSVLIRYEDLVREPETTLRRVCDAIGEAYAEKMLVHDDQWIEWNGVGRSTDADDLGGPLSHHRLRTWQINQPLFDGRGRWQNDLTPEECRRIKALAQPQLEAFGYVADDRWS